MPVQKFLTHEDAQRALWKTPDDPSLLPTLIGLFGWSSRLARVRPTRGVQRFRTLDEAQNERGKWGVDTFLKPIDTPTERSS